MRHPVSSMVAELRRSAETAREAIATKLYGREALRDAMLAAAAAGFDLVTVKGPEGINLSDTEAATAAKEWLAGEKVSSTFKHRDGAGGIEAASTYDLELSWKVTAER